MSKNREHHGVIFDFTPEYMAELVKDGAAIKISKQQRQSKPFRDAFLEKGIKIKTEVVNSNTFIVSLQG